MKRVLVTGAAGMLGGRLASLLSEAFSVVAGVHRASPPEGMPSVNLDLTAPATIESAFDAARPEAVVHAAALADGSRCEQDPELAQAVNIRGTALVAEAAARHGARLVVLSTDLVFAGNGRDVTEEDPPGPLMAYGRTKLEAEEEALRRCRGSAVVRVALVCGRGHGRATASEGVAWALRRGQRLRLFTDEFRTPVDAEAVATAVARLLRGPGEGRFHLGGPERISRYELGLRVASAFGLESSPIEAVQQATLALGAPRPRDVSLDSSRARSDLGFAPRPLDVMIRDGRPEPPPV